MFKSVQSFIDFGINNTIQCWGCFIFDRLFISLSEMVSYIYTNITFFIMIITTFFIVIYVLYVLYNNFKNNFQNSDYLKSIQKTLITSIFAFGLLSSGLFFPRLITMITIEPIASITASYTSSLLQTDLITINNKIDYTPIEFSKDGFYRSELRDKIILLFKLSIYQFQVFIKFGMAIIDKAFSWKAILSPMDFIKHIIIFFLGIGIVFGFFRLFIKYCFYFMDIIINMAFFGIFFPLSIATVGLQNSEAPDWIKNIGKNLGTNQLKTVINSIVSLSISTLTYTIIMVILASFLYNQNSAETMNYILSGNIFELKSIDDNIPLFNILSIFVLLYVIKYIADQIPSITNSVLSEFNIKQETSLNEAMFKNIQILTGNLKKIGKKFLKKK